MNRADVLFSIDETHTTDFYRVCTRPHASGWVAHTTRDSRRGQRCMIKRGHIRTSTLRRTSEPSERTRSTTRTYRLDAPGSPPSAKYLHLLSRSPHDSSRERRRIIRRTCASYEGLVCASKDPSGAQPRHPGQNPRTCTSKKHPSGFLEWGANGHSPMLRRYSDGERKNSSGVSPAMTICQRTFIHAQRVARPGPRR